MRTTRGDAAAADDDDERSNRLLLDMHELSKRGMQRLRARAEELTLASYI